MADGNDADEQGGFAGTGAENGRGKNDDFGGRDWNGGKDVPFLKALAAVGKGSFYLAEHAKQLQRLIYSRRFYDVALGD